MSQWSTAWSIFLSDGSRWAPLAFHSSVILVARSGKRVCALRPSPIVTGLRGTSTLLTTALPLRHDRTNFSSLAIVRCSIGCGSCGVVSVSRGGPGTWASALSRDMVDHTAVIRRKQIRHINKSIIGIMLISESSDLRPPPPPSTLTPPIDVSSWIPKR